MKTSGILFALKLKSLFKETKAAFQAFLLSLFRSLKSAWSAS